METETKSAMLTDTFPPNILPVRSGVYKTRHIDPETGEKSQWGYCYFDATDRIWGCMYIVPLLAEKKPDFEFALQNKEWCGLDKEVV